MDVITRNMGWKSHQHTRAGPPSSSWIFFDWAAQPLLYVDHDLYLRALFRKLL